MKPTKLDDVMYLSDIIQHADLHGYTDILSDIIKMTEAKPLYNEKKLNGALYNELLMDILNKYNNFCIKPEENLR